MIKAMYSEWLKYKRTSIPWLLTIPPFVVVFISTYYVSLNNIDSDTWIQLLDFTNQIWSGVWLPLGWGLIAGLAANIETTSGNWRSLRVRSQSPYKLYGAKILVLAVQTFLSTLLLFILLFIAGGILEIPLDYPWREFSVVMIVNWISGMPLFLFSLWIGEMFGWAISVGFGVFGILAASIIGATIVGNDIWVFIPWAWPVRLVYMGYALVNNNSHLLAPSNIFWSVLIAVICLSILITISSIKWFHRKEIN